MDIKFRPQEPLERVLSYAPSEEIALKSRGFIEELKQIRLGLPATEIHAALQAKEELSSDINQICQQIEALKGEYINGLGFVIGNDSAESLIRYAIRFNDAENPDLPRSFNFLDTKTEGALQTPDRFAIAMQRKIEDFLREYQPLSTQLKILRTKYHEVIIPIDRLTVIQIYNNWVKFNEFWKGLVPESFEDFSQLNVISFARILKEWYEYTIYGLGLNILEELQRKPYDPANQIITQLNISEQ